MTVSDKGKEILRALTKLEKTSVLSINELRVVLALERIVARIEAHKVLRDKLIFKGGFVLLKIMGSQRFTRDLDALADDMPRYEVSKLVEDALSVDLDDGLYFAKHEIDEFIDQGQYGGFRIKIPFQIGSLPTETHKLKKLSRVHLDIGFGDVISGRAKWSKLVPLIDEETAVPWKVYPIESIYAEKLETLISRGSANSRAKDFYDLVIIFDEAKKRKSLVSAIQKTFSNRGTKLPKSFEAFFNSLDFSIIQRSWGSVELTNDKMTFETCKLRLVVILKVIDGLFLTSLL